MMWVPVGYTLVTHQDPKIILPFWSSGLGDRNFMLVSNENGIHNFITIRLLFGGFHHVSTFHLFCWCMCGHNPRQWSKLNYFLINTIRNRFASITVNRWRWCDFLEYFGYYRPNHRYDRTSNHSTILRRTSLLDLWSIAVMVRANSPDTSRYTGIGCNSRIWTRIEQSKQRAKIAFRNAVSIA